MCKVERFVCCGLIALGIIGSVNTEIPKVQTRNVEILELCPPIEDDRKRCNCRENRFSRNYWNYIAGFYCLKYTDVKRYYNDNITINISQTVCSSRDNITRGIYTLHTNDTYGFFDYTNITSMNIFRGIFKTEDYFNLFLACCEEADQCCEQTDESNGIYNSEYCPTIFDGWECYPKTKANTLATKVCSPQTKADCVAYSKKTCTWNAETQLAEWIQDTDYNDCIMANIYKRRHKFNVITLALATIFTFPSIVIFISFHRLRRELRHILHRNLLITIVIRNLFTIMVKENILIHEIESSENGAMKQNTVGCRILTLFENVFKNAMYACMLVDGFYLHKIIISTFNSAETNVVGYYLAVFGMSVFPSVIWATVKGVRNRPYCWLVDFDNEQWIVDSFRICVLVINILILLDIIRVMFTKMKHGKINHKAKAAFKATVFLIPLFGIHFLITAHTGIIWNDSCVAEDLYDYIRYSLEALQGIMVATLFCYINVEVQGEFKNLYRKIKVQMESQFGWHITSRTIRMRRDTTITYFPEERPSLLSL